MGQSFRTLNTLSKPPPSVDGGKEKEAGGDVKSLPATYVTGFAKRGLMRAIINI